MQSTSNLRYSNNNPVDCSEARAGKILLPQWAWAHRLENSWFASLKPSALSRKSIASLLCTGSVEGAQRSIQEERLPDSSFNILPAWKVKLPLTLSGAPTSLTLVDSFTSEYLRKKRISCQISIVNKFREGKTFCHFCANTMGWLPGHRLSLVLD